MQFNGWLNIYKPLGISSAAIVAKIKKLLGKNIKVGHCGTLDPLADGILPLAIGEATKLSGYITDSYKKYVFTIQFGSSTTTGDSEGEIRETCDFLPKSEQDLQNIVKNFIGKLTQQTPAYSAAKINGKTFYKIAREGGAPPERIREIEITDLNLLEYDLNKATATYEVVCSKGTYIRSLAEDIAKSLKSLGFVIRLTRVFVKDFFTSNSLAFNDLIGLADDEALKKINNSLFPVEYVLDDIPVFDLDQDLALKVRRGQKILIHHHNLDLVWLRFKGRILAIGSLSNKEYNIFRNFNL
jgi:tRNA pseudouridine55 synthase